MAVETPNRRPEPVIEAGLWQAASRGVAEPPAESQLRQRFVVMLRAWLAAHSGSVDAAFAADAARCLPAADLDVVVNGYYRQQDSMLYDR